MQFGPLFDQQWYIYNDGQEGRTPRVDLNLIDHDPNTSNVWDDYTGEGVSISVVDTGIQATHENLIENYDFDPSGLTPPYDLSEATPVPDPAGPAHGTAVAGIISGGQNGIGTTGVAFNSNITGFRFSDIFDETGGIEANPANPLMRQAAFDISNNSWAPGNPFVENFKTDPELEEALEVGITQGRDGLGTVFVWGAGNSREALGYHANYNNLTNSRHTIAVAAIDGQGIAAPYSSQGANLLVSAFGDGDGDEIPGTIATTDFMEIEGYNNPLNPENPDNTPNLNYTTSFDGTSAAAPMVSGVVGLMLEANPYLGHRDVQEILAYSARQNDPTHDDWQFNGAENWNGGGLHANHDYGFGLVDGHTAVRLAESWTLQNTWVDQPSQRTWVNEASLAESSDAAVEIPDGATISDSITLPEGLELQQTEIAVDVSHEAIEDLVITLTSPSGTESVLFDGSQLETINLSIDEMGNPLEAPFAEFRDNPQAFTEDPIAIELGERYQDGIDFTFSSTFNWSETSEGEWTLTIEDGESGIGGTLNNWDLEVYGDEMTPNETYIYTEEYGQLNDPERQVLSNPEGTHTINAAMRSDSLIDINPGATGVLAGQPLTIDENTQIENVWGGDGNDTLLGNEDDNRLINRRGDNLMWSEAGDNFIEGGDGNDTLIGGSGQDSLTATQGDNLLMGGPGDDRIIAGRGNDTLVGGQGNDILEGSDGDDVLSGDLGNDTLIGGGGNNTFVLRPNGGENVITDFNAETDQIGLADGLTQEALTISQAGADAILEEGTETRAILNDADSSLLTPDQFVMMDW
ncbi:S8 family serine peptidase [Sodalinema gerasimenkoae]|uniref:S8 family serine peptidase n=1 Tax=Sodalinema gerasimenkoae TaxID=2862348 RepID=UPI001359F46C|nr:S8 family serine peptidase [Sodalinema gerasimenkoae]